MQLEKNKEFELNRLWLQIHYKGKLLTDSVLWIREEAKVLPINSGGWGAKEIVAEIWENLWKFH